MAKILVIDDDPDSVTYLTSVLEGTGREFISARDGDAGVKAARAKRPDLIILDVEMPKKDGFTVLTELRQDETTRDIPVLILTGIGDRTGIEFSAADVGDFLGIEPEAYIEKPVAPQALKDAVDRLLSRPRKP